MKEAAIAEKKDPDVEPGYLKRFFEFLSQTDFELNKIGFSAYGAFGSGRNTTAPAARAAGDAVLSALNRIQHDGTKAAAFTGVRAAGGGWRISG